MLLVIGPNALARQDDIPVALIGVNCSHSDASMRIDSRNNNWVGIQVCEDRVKIGTKERAIALLHDEGLGREQLQPRDKLGAERASDGDRNTFGFHFEEGITQVRFKFLTTQMMGRPCARISDTRLFVD